jgi:superkiller protein 3
VLDVNLIGRLITNLGLTGQDQEPSYTCFITALKRSSTFAPAFTSLGIYYLELADPPDPGRASKCFQKAFELDAREGDAARRLAQGFADDREWDLVEVVAKRTIEGEGGIEGGNIGKSGGQLTVGRFSPTHAWAWRAVGVVELVRVFPLFSYRG